MRVTNYCHCLLLPIAIGLLTATVLISCYTFTGASISPEVKTLTVGSFPNQASLVNPSLSRDFTEKLKEKFLSQTNLTMVKAGGDLEFEGAITNYYVTPAAATGNETAALSRLSISVRVKFTNHIEPAKSWESTFTEHADFDANKNLAEVENQLVAEINDLLVDKIFNKAVVNW